MGTVSVRSVGSRCVKLKRDHYIGSERGSRMERLGNKDWLALLAEQNQIQEIVSKNEKTEQFGLVLTEEEARELTAGRVENLKEQQRVEFGEGILPKLIDAFCDSPYLDHDHYAHTLAGLQEIFYLYKNETSDELTDDELLEFMREQFDDPCFGDLDYLSGTCLDLFAQAIRAGYRTTMMKGAFQQFDIVKRWDKDLFLQALTDLM